MRVVIVGSSGFVGQALMLHLNNQGHKVDPLSIRKETKTQDISDVLQSCDILINLAGVSIFGRWSASYKKALYDSRIDTTKKLLDALIMSKKRPKIFISTSAIGIYPDEIPCDEKTENFSSSFLSQTCQDWEKEAMRANELGIKTSIFRFGVVLGKSGGMIKKIWLPFSFGLGGRIGSGRQSLSWIHIRDLCYIYDKVIKEEREGVYNLCSPQPTNNMELTKILGSLLNRPTFFPVPAFVLRLMFGEGADFMLHGQKVYPKKLLDLGFEFKYKDIKTALSSFL